MGYRAEGRDDAAGLKNATFRLDTVVPQSTESDDMSESNTLPAVAAHGGRRLPSVDVDSYNVELKDDEGFIGDRAEARTFAPA